MTPFQKDLLKIDSIRNFLNEMSEKFPEYKEAIDKMKDCNSKELDMAIKDRRMIGF